MQNLWNDQEATQHTDDLALRVYTSRLLGQEKMLVLHGGGNTSVKIRTSNILGEEEDILYVKGSGWDLETIAAAGFSPVRLQHLVALAKLPELNDIQMVNELRTHMTLASAPTPSVEAILHAIIPHKFVDHTHADAVVSITNTKNGLKKIQGIYGDEVIIIPYVMPGFDLARVCNEIYTREATDKTIGMILMNHGVFSFGETAKIAYTRMIELVTRAEQFLESNNAWLPLKPSPRNTESRLSHDIASLRYQASREAGFPLLLMTHRNNHCLGFAQRDDLATISQQGPATPDHVIRTKRIPLLGRDVTAYSKQYQNYFDEFSPQAKDPKTILDRAPRVILDSELGLCTLGRSVKDADIVADIYSQTINTILRAERLGGYQALPAKDIFDVEYWDLEQAKLKKGGNPPELAGEIALVTGAASGIGKACAENLLKQGAAVVGIDIDPAIENLFDNPGFAGIICDVADTTQITNTIEACARKFGGLDMLVLNAGIFPASCRIESLEMPLWNNVFRINLDANLALLRECYPLLKLAPNKGRVVIIGSKNVAAPGPGAAAYSASKAALNQLARIAALEWAQDSIRINTVHPDAVFDTGIWNDDILQSRAKHYDISVDEYKTKNLLKTNISSDDVAKLVAAMCGPLFDKTTAAQVPIDGGNERVI